MLALLLLACNVVCYAGVRLRRRTITAATITTDADAAADDATADADPAASAARKPPGAPKALDAGASDNGGRVDASGTFDEPPPRALSWRGQLCASRVAFRRRGGSGSRAPWSKGGWSKGDAAVAVGTGGCVLGVLLLWVLVAALGGLAALRSNLSSEGFVAFVVRAHRAALPSLSKAPPPLHVGMGARGHVPCASSSHGHAHVLVHVHGARACA